MEAMHKGQHVKQGHYGRLLLMTALSFVAMFILMYAMVDRFANVYANFNQVYMAGLMAALMAIIETNATDAARRGCLAVNTAAELGAQVKVPPQYWRSEPRDARGVFANAAVGQR